jgi:hypothetical protein
MSTIIDGTTGITTDGLTSVGSISTNGIINTGTITTSALIVGTATAQLIKLETAKASTSGTTVDFTGIPSWAKKITVMFKEVSLNNTGGYLVQLGDSGGIETTGYVNTVFAGGAGGNTTGFFLSSGAASEFISGHLVLILMGSNLWISSTCANTGTGGGTKTLSDTLDRVRITPAVGGVNFDSGSINILIEGSL